MAKKPEPIPPIRAISILVGVIFGCVLAYAYHANLPTLFYEMNVSSLVVFVAIPTLVGFVVALIHPAMAMKNGLYAGLFSGLFNSIIATVKLIYVPVLKTGEVYAFSLFSIMSVFIWMILAAATAMLTYRFYDYD